MKSILRLHFFKWVFTSFLLLVIAQTTFACDKSSASLTSQTNNGNGTFTFVFNVCREYLGLEGAPDQLIFTFNCGVTVAAGFSPASYNTSTNDVYTGVRSGSTLTYTTPSIFIAHGSSTLCGSFTITTSGYPTSVSINTHPGYSSATCTKTFTLSTLSAPSASASPTSVCVNGTSALSASSCPGGNLKWYDAASGGTLLLTGANYSTSPLAGTTSYYVDCSYTTGGCASARTPVTVSVTPTPSAPSASAAPTSVCENASSILSASGCASGTLSWFSNSSGGSPLQTGASYTTPALSTPTSYYVGCTVSGCPSARTPVSIGINALPSAPIASASQNDICPNTSADLIAAGCGNGTLDWYDVASGGGSLQTGASFTTPSLTADATFYVSCTENGCTSARSAVPITVTACPLPLELLSFKSTCVNEHVQLFWETSADNNAHYMVEKSIDDISFVPTAATIGKNSNNQSIQYIFTDDAQTQVAYYYRVVQLETDGTRTESRSLRTDGDCGKHNLSISNYAVTESGLNLLLLANENDRVMISLIDMSGKVLYAESFDVLEGFNNLNMPHILPSGMFILKANSSSRMDTKKILNRY